VLDPLASTVVGGAATAIVTATIPSVEVCPALFSAESGGAAASLEGSVALGEAGPAVPAGVGGALVGGRRCGATAAAAAEEYLSNRVAGAKRSRGQSGGRGGLEHAILIGEKVGVGDDGVFVYFGEDVLEEVGLVVIGQAVIRLEKIVGGGFVGKIGTVGRSCSMAKIPRMLVRVRVLRGHKYGR